MNVTMTFALHGDDGLEEQRRLELCLKAEAMHGLLSEIDEHLRQRAKHGDLSDAALDEVEALRRWMLDGIRNLGIPWE
jgi:hypothetical protein